MQVKDTYTAYGAGLLAKTIEAYWHERGHRSVRVERYQIDGFPGMWGVRSNLVNGKPSTRTLEERYEAVLDSLRDGENVS